MPSASTTPLLRAAAGATAAVGAPPTAIAPLSRLQRFAVIAFSVLRILRGLCFMVYPALGLSSFDIPRDGGTFLLGSLLGGRDVLLGGLLLTADGGGVGVARARDRREVRRALLVILLSDALDTFILIFSAAALWHWRNPFVEIASVALLAVLEHLTLWSMRDDDGLGDEDASKAYQAILRADEDKKNRLSAWLSELRRVEETRTASPTAQEQGR